MNEYNFRTGAINPIECIIESWNLIKQDYWLFLGICLLGIVGGSFAPLGILIGPMMCGVYYCYLSRMSGKEVSLNLLMKGFDHFLQSFIATMVQILPVFLIMIPIDLVLFFTVFSQMRHKSDPTFIFLPLIGTIVVSVVISMLLGILFIFAFPLIVDKGLSGIDAVKLSVRAVLANFGGIFSLLLLCGMITSVGILACYIGTILVLPVTFGAYAIAYRKIFPQSSTF